MYALFEADRQCVLELADHVQISESHASLHLRALNSRGLITACRRKLKVFYTTEANPEVDAAPVLLRALRTCYQGRVPIKVLKKQATAFTHPRRIEMMRLISTSGISIDALTKKTGISSAALNRHLNKLHVRGFVSGKNNCYRAQTPPDALSRALLRIVREEL